MGHGSEASGIGNLISLQSQLINEIPIQPAVPVAAAADQQILEFAAVFDFALDQVVLLQQLSGQG